MIRWLADENFNNDIIRGLKRRVAGVDVLRVQDVGLSSEADERVLAWAAENNRLLLSHDTQTMPDHFYERMSRGDAVSGVILVPERMDIGFAIEQIIQLSITTEYADWLDRVVKLPS